MTHSPETSTATLLQPAFVDPARDAQQNFRAALKALSEPGTIRLLTCVPAVDTLQPAGYALCLSLLDTDTPLWLSPSFDTPAIRTNLAFHCGCPFTRERREASFALLDVGNLSDLSGFSTGSERYPDQSCTLLIQLDNLENGNPLNWHGPGIDGTREVPLPVPGEFWRQRTLRCNFPRGLDSFFIAVDSIIGLPRNTRVNFSLEEAA